MNNKDETMDVPGLGRVNTNEGFIYTSICSDGLHRINKDGVRAIITTGDGKVEFIVFENTTLAFVKSNLGYPAYYKVLPVELKKPVKAVLMDLDGTTERSEEFWVWIIQMTTASLMGNTGFELEDADLPFVSGHGVSEHLKYCINKYCPEKSLEDARKYYFEHTHHEMNKIMKGKGKKGAFMPTPGIKDFLLELKAMGIKIGLVTSGLYEKAFPEILSAFDTLGMGDPKDFYDCIITAGFPLRKGEVGTLGELSPKPHPWLYAEACRIGLGISFEERSSVVGIEDSGAGICSIRLAGFPSIGIGGGNIIKSGTRGLCNYYCDKFQDILAIIRD